MWQWLIDLNVWAEPIMNAVIFIACVKYILFGGD